MNTATVALIGFLGMVLVVVLKFLWPATINRILGSHKTTVEEPPGNRINPRPLIEKLPTGLLVLTTDFEVAFANEAVASELDRERDQIEGRSLGELFQDADGLMQALSQTEQASDTEPNNASLTYTNREGQKDKLQITITRQTIDDQSYFVAVIPTFTDLVGARDQIRQSERLQTLGEMISGLAHEINNPLTGVIGFVNLLLEDDRTDPVENELDIIQENADRCKDIIDNLLNFVRPGESGIQELDLNDILETSVKLIHRNLDIADIEINTNYDPELPTVPANQTQIEEVFMNLLTNAEQELSELGEDSERVIRVTTRPLEDDSVLIRIEDSGRGIPEERRDQVFDAFHTTKGESEGAGLGLSITQGIIQELGGEITIDDSDLGGARFDIVLPASEAETNLETQSHDAEQSKALPDSIDRILVVEDEESIRDLFQQFTDRLNIDGHFAETPIDAIDILEHGTGELPDIIVLDLVYPGQLKGQDLVTWLNENEPELLDSVIIITGNPHDDQLDSIRSITDAPLINKPLSLDDFLGTINRMRS